MRDVWEFILRNGPFPENTTIPRETLNGLKKEFDYWYPVDIRISGLELLPNPLSFYLYTHRALFPPEKWPKSIRANGHIKLDGRKMAKREGNFITAADAIETYTADGTRLGLAVAGDSLEQANFSPQTSESGIIRFYALISWVKEIMGSLHNLRTGPTTLFEDRVFDSQINRAIEESDKFYEQTLFCEAIRVGFFELQSAKDHYRTVLETQRIAFHRDLILRFMEVQAILLSPVCPHVAQQMWKILGKEGFVAHSRWPQGGEIDHVILSQNSFLEDVIYDFRNKVTVYKKTKARAQSAKITEATIYVSDTIPEWRKQALGYLESVYQNGKFPPTQEIVDRLQKDGGLAQHIPDIMPVIAHVQKNVGRMGKEAFHQGLPYNEKDFLQDHLVYIRSTLDIPQINIEMENIQAPKTNAVSGKPGFVCHCHILPEQKR
eukprot:Phypoly_transcript_08852.p1 GENE.Phypoly_transcript_08852~~Phypoly_transcript_08852.p1  ORF type:complete len:478 (+),score=74.54 Phypoly_transcript_08852:135-1436(+)